MWLNSGDIGKKLGQMKFIHHSSKGREKIMKIHKLIHSHTVYEWIRGKRWKFRDLFIANGQGHGNVETSRRAINFALRQDDISTPRVCAYFFLFQPKHFLFFLYEINQNIKFIPSRQILFPFFFSIPAHLILIGKFPPTFSIFSAHVSWANICLLKIWFCQSWRRDRPENPYASFLFAADVEKSQ